MNLLILEEEEEPDFCFREGQNYKCKVKAEKYIQELAQFLGICYCILVGLMGDRLNSPY